MTITQLKYTLSVAEHGNFTTASEKCFVTQPTLSMQVQKLEEELGVTIFNRSTKPLKVTEVGEKVLNQARKIIEESSRMDDIISEEKGVIAEGKLVDRKFFIASRILAKHDENYMPPKLKKMMKKDVK